MLLTVQSGRGLIILIMNFILDYVTEINYKSVSVESVPGRRKSGAAAAQAAQIMRPRQSRHRPSRSNLKNECRGKPATGEPGVLRPPRPADRAGR